MARRTIRNRFLALSADGRGRVVSLKNRLTGTELVSHPKAAEAWRMVLATGRHTIDVILGSAQTPRKLEVVREGGRQSLVAVYDRLTDGRGRSVEVRARFVLALEAEGPELSAHVEIENRGPLAVDEVEFPVLGGLGGFPERSGKRRLNLLAASDRGDIYEDVLHRGLPETGRESNHFVREHETAMFESDGRAGAWLDLWGRGQGLYLGYHSREGRDFAFKIEKFPKEVPNGRAHRYPPGTARWLRASALHVPRLAPGARWNSPKVTVMPHRGDWHAGADRYSSYRHESLALAEPPAWMEGFTGWTEILGKTYLGEVFHDFRGCAAEVLREEEATGLDLVFYYGHTAIGAEGADFDQGPAPDLGGEKEFRRMIEKLHRGGCRVMLLDHLHRWVNREVPEYRRLGMERYAVLGPDGTPRTTRWWKETFLSCRRLAGPTPVWVEMCPSCGEWWEHYLRQMIRLVEMGVDGLELDTFNPSPCHNPGHDHPPGADMLPVKIERMRSVRAELKRLNPDFLLAGETMVPEARAILDCFYPARYRDERDRIYRYLFPEIREQAVLIGNYAYDQVNKALALGIGVETEIWGLRRTARRACPQLARYIGQVNRLKRKFPEVLTRGAFRDTVGARVQGDLHYSVLEGADGSRALVLRNPQGKAVRARAGFAGGTGGRRLLLASPGRRERRLRRLPAAVTVGPCGAAVLLALARG